ncbi:hypothetical protein [Xanthomonas campestris]|uniref:hypothetical protein n=1 Tax=Xanthomonas campestris TaxID=339 RepID=UPI0023681F54|nr:hypothetical protein [Xanthomonas campestris]WDJ35698.1 hypothetical protein JH256_05275 [Xanthomonas campestris pv. campestris]WDJ82023.1 hypothetical protein JH309_05275 [Xanthomonas campestris pv. campestris]WDK30868.1 hypothetical protein JH307_16640 [Xanthomonas campestris]
MKVEQFWNKAFLAALTRLPADEAKAEADKATELCINHWRSHATRWAPKYLVAWKDQEINKIHYKEPNP